jgi:uncharacterized membrane protein YeaQ/YmgE (transglycosylase-associated protein family)
MESVGWIGAIIIGGLAGWLAGKFMDMRFGVFMNIILGIVGSVVAIAVLKTLDVFVQDSRLGYFVTAFLGASLLLFVAKIVRR